MQVNNRSDVRRQLRERKRTVDNIQNQNIKPFTSHRKQKLEDRIKVCSVSNVEDKENVPYLPRKTILQNNYQTRALENLENRNSPVVQHIIENTNEKNLELAETNKFRTTQQDIRLIGNQKQEIQSIIFDSKITQFESYADIKKANNGENQLQQASYLERFKKKAEKINAEIEGGLTKLQEEIRDLKQKMQRKRRTKQQQKKISVCTNQSKPTSDKPLMVVSDKSSSQNIRAQTSETESKEGPKDSQIQLQGNIDKNEYFPPEYISLINRLARQIEKDIEFTSSVNHYTKTNQIGQIRTLFLKEIKNLNLFQGQFDESFLKIQPSEIDPLDHGIASSSQKLTPQSIQEHCLSLMKSYRDMQAHYQNKLYKKFQASTIELLFRQLCQFNFAVSSGNSGQSLTVGHLLSYLNMRTNKSFRNRSFVKMLKRLNIKPNSLINLSAFLNLVKP